MMGKRPPRTRAASLNANTQTALQGVEGSVSPCGPSSGLTDSGAGLTVLVLFWATSFFQVNAADEEKFCSKVAVKLHHQSAGRGHASSTVGQSDLKSRG